MPWAARLSVTAPNEAPGGRMTRAVFWEVVQAEAERAERAETAERNERAALLHWGRDRFTTRTLPPSPPSPPSPPLPPSPPCSSAHRGSAAATPRRPGR